MGVYVLSGANGRESGLIKGKVLRSKDHRLLSHLETVIQTTVDHLHRLGMRDVRQPRADSVTFRGKPWLGVVFNFNIYDLSFQQFVASGLIRISPRGSQLAAHYFLSISISLLLAPLTLAILPFFIFPDFFAAH